jgi:hypothetical protein
MTSAVLALLVAGLTAPDFVLRQITEALQTPTAKVSVVKYVATLPSGCSATAAIVTSTPASGGDFIVRLTGTTATGTTCEGWGHAFTTITVPMLVTTKAVPAGAALEGSVALMDRPWRASTRPVELHDGAMARTALPAGTVIEKRHVRDAGPDIGDAVTVDLRSGGISISQAGRLTSCTGDWSCATLPSGKHVQGRLEGSHLFVEVR